MKHRDKNPVPSLLTFPLSWTAITTFSPQVPNTCWPTFSVSCSACSFMTLKQRQCPKPPSPLQVMCQRLLPPALPCCLLSYMNVIMCTAHPLWGTGSHHFSDQRGHYSSSYPLFFCITIFSCLLGHSWKHRNMLIFLHSFSFFFFFLFYIVVDFVIHWNETAMGLHVFPIPIPPPTSFSTWSL